MSEFVASMAVSFFPFEDQKHLKSYQGIRYGYGKTPGEAKQKLIGDAEFWFEEYDSRLINCYTIGDA